MAINIEFFLKQKFEQYQLYEAVKTIELYKDIKNYYQQNLFSILHQEFNRLINFMYKKSNGHFNANESRQLIEYIKLYEDMKYVLKNTNLSFGINESYKVFLNECKLFLMESGGSAIPNDLKRINLIEYEPIFTMNRSIKVSANKEEKRYDIKLIGEGSYAHVFKYKDEFYDKNFAIKRAKKELNEKELIRFKQEYLIMKELKSPYVLEVYGYDEIVNEYYLEYANETIYDYIINNNSKINYNTRKNIAYQVFKAFSYIHSKGYLHRDISLTNVLLIIYEDVIVVKISDFGMVKDKYSNLTSTESEVKGSLNDSYLSIIGFRNYSMVYETYALTRLILFIMTGKTNIENIEDERIKSFVLKGISRNIDERYKNVEDMKEYFNKTFN